jgi:hypothetical protein
VNCKGYGKKQSWYNYSGFLEELIKTNKTLVRIKISDIKNIHPHYKSEMLTPETCLVQ